MFSPIARSNRGQEMLDEAKRFRDSGLPCDAMIYLGTGFTTSGWNKGHGSFEFNDQLFSDPKGLFDELHADNFKVVLHFVNPPLTLHGSVHDEGPETEAEDHARNYWEKHRPVARYGVDGWWPDIGDMLSPAAGSLVSACTGKGPSWIIRIFGPGPCTAMPMPAFSGMAGSGRVT